MNSNGVTIIAVYGAALSTLTFAWEIWKAKQNRPMVRIEASLGAVIGDPRRSGPRLMVGVINEGVRPVTVVATGLEIRNQPDGNRATIADYELPQELHEGKRHTSYMTFDALERIGFENIVRAWARDATGREHWSKMWPFAIRRPWYRRVLWFFEAQWLTKRRAA